MSYTHITHTQRVQLAILLRAGFKPAEIARQLDKDRSTIGRELKRNATNNKSGYNVAIAQRLARARRSEANQRFRKIWPSNKLAYYIELRLKKQYWSPDEIAGRLKQETKQAVISHETIYQYIYRQKPSLKKYLRCKKGKYRRRYGTKKREKAREEAKKRRIDQRPAVVDKRARLGDWEGDLVEGSRGSGSILTHVDRKSGLLLADKLTRSVAKEVNQKTITRMGRLPKSKRLTITYDNGSCFSHHELIERNLGATVYFAYPYRSLERGTNENTNGLLRQFFPKGSSFAQVKQTKVDKVVALINNRPRKRLNYLTPLEVFLGKKSSVALWI